MIHIRNAFILLVLISSISFLPAAPKDNSPLRVILSLTETPDVSMAVTWRTDLLCENPRVEFMKATAEVNRKGNRVKSREYIKVKTVAAVSETVKTGIDIVVYSHSAVIKGLEPETLYQYRVGYGTSWSEWEHFKTAASLEKPFRFIYLGDPQNQLKKFCSRMFRTAYSSAPDAAFVLVAGDLVSMPWKDNLWGELFYAAGWITRRLPFVMVAGNHSYYYENRKDENKGKQHWLWRPHFTQPGNGPEGLDETAFTYVYQGVRFIVLNSLEKLNEQAGWTESILNKNRSRWTILVNHYPIYSTGRDKDNVELQKLFLPIIDKYGVDLVLQGHDHTYGRSFKLKGGKIVGEHEKGTYYVVTSSGSKFYKLTPQNLKRMAKSGTGLQLYQVITVEKDSIVYESRLVTGELFDSFGIRK